MRKLTCDDAFALALIVQRPKENSDLVPLLSFNAKPIGLCLIGAMVPDDYPDYPELQKTLDQLKNWAEYAPKRKQERYNKCNLQKKKR